MISRLRRLLFILLLLPALALAQSGQGSASGAAGTSGSSAASAPIMGPQGSGFGSQGASQSPGLSGQGEAPSPGFGNQGGRLAPASGPAGATPATTDPRAAPRPGSSAEDQASQRRQAQSGQADALPQLERNEFQDFIAQSTGRLLPRYGIELFAGAPSTFAPVENIPMTLDYVIGPGDELLMRVWGRIDGEYRLAVDREGNINIPQVGTISVSGIRIQDLQVYLRNAIARNFRDFELSVSLGKLRSIQVFVVGQARRPGSYSVSSLSTLVNALFASGGPSGAGSMRRIQLRRGDKTVSEFDVYDFLSKGDKSKDVRLLPGDVIYIPPEGQLVAIAGSVKVPAIYELKDKASLADVIDLAGGLNTTAAGQKVLLERDDPRGNERDLTYPIADKAA